MIQEIKEIYLKNYDSLLNEIGLYENENDIWTLADGISNCSGNLILHLNGNLNLFIGTVLGNTGYVRDRDREFSDKNIPQQKLLADTLATKIMIDTVLSAIPEENINALYPSDKFGDKTIAYALMYFLAHFNYHLGQINYHRRLLTNQSK